MMTSSVPKDKPIRLLIYLSDCITPLNTHTYTKSTVYFCHQGRVRVVQMASLRKTHAHIYTHAYICIQLYIFMFIHNKDVTDFLYLDYAYVGTLLPPN